MKKLGYLLLFSATLSFTSAHAACCQEDYRSRIIAAARLKYESEPKPVLNEEELSKKMLSKLEALHNRKPFIVVKKGLNEATFFSNTSILTFEYQKVMEPLWRKLIPQIVEGEVLFHCEPRGYYRTFSEDVPTLIDLLRRHGGRAPITGLTIDNGVGRTKVRHVTVRFTEGKLSWPLEQIADETGQAVPKDVEKLPIQFLFGWEPLPRTILAPVAASADASASAAEPDTAAAPVGRVYFRENLAPPVMSSALENALALLVRPEAVMNKLNTPYPLDFGSCPNEPIPRKVVNNTLFRTPPPEEGEALELFSEKMEPLWRECVSWILRRDLLISFPYRQGFFATPQMIAKEMRTLWHFHGEKDKIAALRVEIEQDEPRFTINFQKKDYYFSYPLQQVADERGNAVFDDLAIYRVRKPESWVKPSADPTMTHGQRHALEQLRDALMEPDLPWIFRVTAGGCSDHPSVSRKVLKGQEAWLKLL